MTGLASERQKRTGLYLNGTDLGDLGWFDEDDGGDWDSDVSKATPAGLPEEIVDGIQTTDDMTLTRTFRRERDRPLLIPLARARGKVRGHVYEQFYDPDGNPFGKQITQACMLKTSTKPGSDSESSDPAKLTAVVVMYGEPNG